jgi:Zn-dependent M28 family amino/carboxypeptidase
MIREVRNSILYDRKATAKSKGAAGLLAIGIDGTSGEERYVLPSDSFPMIKISQNFANHLLAHAGATVTATIQSVKQQVSSQNVVAYMETGDSPNENDFIAIGAHYDHIGTQMSGDSMLINNGADDNASGVAGLLEIAEKIRSAENLKYNVLFVAFGAEELGLIGSHFFCENPPLPLEKIKLMVNLHMIGRMDSVNHVYINTIEPNVPLNTVVDEVKSSHPDINAILAFGSYRRGSDHTSFYNKHIPAIFFTTGLHSAYHTPADTIGAINYKGEKQALDFIYDFILKEEGH